MSAPIKCIEPGCNCYIENPCATIPVYFGLRSHLESLVQTTNDENVKQDLLDQIVYAKIKITKTGLQNSEEHYKNYITANAAILPMHIKAPKVFTLECIKGHRNTYLIECD